jgi:predicted CoA-binding protein
MILTDTRDIQELLARSPRVAVLGASTNESKAGYYVPAYLRSQGYEIVPVNPVAAGAALHGTTVRATLAEVGEVDLVDVFRRPDQLPGHLDELIALGPKAVWFQLGIRNDAVAQALADAGITVVQDRCTLADHKRWGLGAPR